MSCLSLSINEAGLRCCVLRGGLSARFCIALPEALNPACSVHDFLLASIERMAGGADLDVQVATQYRAGLEGVAAAADYVYLFVVRMNSGFHVRLLQGRGHIVGSHPGTAGTASIRLPWFNYRNKGRGLSSTAPHIAMRD